MIHRPCWQENAHKGGEIQLFSGRKTTEKHLARQTPCAAIRQNPRSPQKFWTAVAACRGEAQRRLEHSGDTAFRLRTELPKRRGSRSAGFPPQSKKICLAWPRYVFALGR